MRTSIIQFVLAALLVAIIGGFTGWYFFIKGKTNETAIAAQGRGDEASFGGSLGSTYQNITGESGTTTAEIGKKAPRLWQIVKTPVAGFGFGAGGASIFFAERATGNILRADPQTSSIVRLTNTLMPKIRDAYFSRSGDVILRTENDTNTVTTFAATIATSTIITATSSPNMLSGTYLPQDIVALDVADNLPTSKGLFFLTKVPEGGSVGVTSGWKGTPVKKIFTSPLSQWHAQALPDGRVVLTQSPADDVAGYSFVISSAGVMKPLITDLPGLTVRYHDTADAYLYGTAAGGALTLYAKVGGSDAVKLPVNTTAEKCVWAPGAGLIAYCAVPTVAPGTGYFERMYQGDAHTIDVWWKIEAAAGTASRFFVPDSRTNFDVEDPSIDETGSYIGWRNAADKSLWALRISE